MAVVVVARLIAVLRGIRAAGGKGAANGADARGEEVCGYLRAELRHGRHSAEGGAFNALCSVKAFLAVLLRKGIALIRGLIKPAGRLLSALDGLCVDLALGLGNGESVCSLRFLTRTQRRVAQVVFQRRYLLIERGYLLAVDVRHFRAAAPVSLNAARICEVCALGQKAALNAGEQTGAEAPFRRGLRRLRGGSRPLFGGGLPYGPVFCFLGTDFKERLVQLLRAAARVGVRRSLRSCCLQLCRLCLKIGTVEFFSHCQPPLYPSSWFNSLRCFSLISSKYLS